ncbi:hypothetical protein [Rhizobium binxianense]|uniref:hypothetical protein n=1 Tax=Rhizobium binxianense TaxID=3024242 RepID=UPI00234E6C2A|nr:hypothetical protein [Rhizobium sp. BC56]MDC7742478.1 hypothetical protein [Rhizobium sp. BC56]
MMTVHDIEQVDAVLCEDGRNVGFYAWRADDESIFWSIPLPMVIQEDAFEDLLPAWVELGWSLLTRL